MLIYSDSPEDSPPKLLWKNYSLQHVESNEMIYGF